MPICKSSSKNIYDHLADTIHRASEVTPSQTSHNLDFGVYIYIYIIIYIYYVYIIYNTYYISQSVVWQKYFTSRLIYFHEPEVSENKT